MNKENQIIKPNIPINTKTNTILANHMILKYNNRPSRMATRENNSSKSRSSSRMNKQSSKNTQYIKGKDVIPKTFTKDMWYKVLSFLSPRHYVKIRLLNKRFRCIIEKFTTFLINSKIAEANKLFLRQRGLASTMDIKVRGYLDEIPKMTRRYQEIQEKMIIDKKFTQDILMIKSTDLPPKIAFEAIKAISYILCTSEQREKYRVNEWPSILRDRYLIKKISCKKLEELKYEGEEIFDVICNTNKLTVEGLYRINISLAEFFELAFIARKIMSYLKELRKEFYWEKYVEVGECKDKIDAYVYFLNKNLKKVSCPVCNYTFMHLND